MTMGLQPTDFNLYEGEICAIIGRNGAGKSTLFKLIANQIHPTVVVSNCLEKMAIILIIRGEKSRIYD